MILVRLWSFLGLKGYKIFRILVFVRYCYLDLFFEFFFIVIGKFSCRIWVIGYVDLFVG